MTRLKAEMEVPPQDMSWNGHAPRRVEANAANVQRRKQEFDSNGAPLRRETQSGIPGLTYDQAGRPVYVLPHPDRFGFNTNLVMY
jgi:hypothetical protein